MAKCPEPDAPPTALSPRRMAWRLLESWPPIAPPLPLLDVNDCWLPTEEQVTAWPGALEVKAGSREQQTLRELLKEGQRELGLLLGEAVERQLEAYHAGLLQRLATELHRHSACTNCGAGGGIVPPDVVLASKRSVTFTGCESCGELRPSSVDMRGSTVYAATEADEAAERGVAGEESQENLYRHSFDQSEMLRINKSRQASAVAAVAEAMEREESIVQKCRTSTPTKSVGGAAPNWVRQIVETPTFEAGVAILTVLNICVMGFEVEYLYGRQETPLAIWIVDNLFTLFFVGELAVRVSVLGFHGFVCGPQRAMNLMEAALTMVALMELVLEVAMQVSPHLNYLRVIRMARTVRIFRVVRVMKVFRPMRILVYSVVNTIRSLFWTLVLLAIIIYLYALMFTTAAGNYTGDLSPEARDNLQEYFGSLGNSGLTLFKSITNGVDWQDCHKSLRVLNPMWGFAFLGYIAVGQLAVLNVVTGVVCQTAIESATKDQDIIVHSQLDQQQRYVNQFHDLFTKFDSDRSGYITLQEFEEHLHEPELKNYFAAMDLTVNEAWSFFKLLDTGGSGRIDVEVFVTGCLKLRGTARSIDVHMLMYESKWTMKKLSNLMHLLEKEHAGPRRTRTSRSGTVSMLSCPLEVGSVLSPR